MPWNRKSCIGHTVYVGLGEEEDQILFRFGSLAIPALCPGPDQRACSANVNPLPDLNEIISSLKKYSGSADLIIGIHVNRREPSIYQRLAFQNLVFVNYDYLVR
jgi:hypothetical protein